MIIEFCKLGTSLGTRQLGERIRKEIIQGFHRDESIIFDFKNINVVANSFADECFGKLVEQFGVEFLSSKTKFVDMNEFVSLVIKKSIVDRIRNNSNTCCTCI